MAHCFRSSVGANHRRDRIIIVAYPHDTGSHRTEINPAEAGEPSFGGIGGCCADVAYPDDTGNGTPGRGTNGDGQTKEQGWDNITQSRACRCCSVFQAEDGIRLKRVTEPGQQVLKCIDIILREVNNLKRIGEQYSAQDSGNLSIATTHTQARYVLPVPVAQLRSAYPNVSISLHQGAPDQVAKMVLDETAEIGIATESLSDYAELVTLPCYEWEHVLVLPKDHPLVSRKSIQLADLASEPIITYHPSLDRKSTRLNSSH